MLINASRGECVATEATKRDDLTYVIRFAIACSIAIVSLVILYFLLKILKTDLKAFYKVAVVCVCIISAIYGNVYVACGRAHSYEIKEVMIDSLIEGEVDFEDDDAFRIDTYDCVDNTAMYLGYSGINAFHSVVPSSVMEFYEYIGVERSVASRPDTDYVSIRPLLSVKYLLNRVDGDAFIDEDTKETEMEGYTYIDTKSGYYIYENDNYIPYGFSYQYYMSEEYCDNYSDEERANLMLKAILLSDSQIEKYGKYLYNFEEMIRNPAPYDEDRSLYSDYEDIVYDCDKLRDSSALEFKTDKRGFSATVERESENLVFFSIPYDEGWTATVNGKPCTIEKVNKGFMAVLVPKGTSHIRFDYETPGLKIGLLVTAVSCGLFLLYMLGFILWKRKHSSRNEYPEGEILIKSWIRAEDEEEIPQEIKETLSLLDKVDEIVIPKIENGFEGGFKIIDQGEDKK